MEIKIKAKSHARDPVKRRAHRNISSYAEHDDGGQTKFSGTSLEVCRKTFFLVVRQMPEKNRPLQLPNIRVLINNWKRW